LVVVHGINADNSEARITLHQLAHYRYDNINSFEFSTKNGGEYSDTVVMFCHIT